MTQTDSTSRQTAAELGVDCYVDFGFPLAIRLRHPSPVEVMQFRTAKFGIGQVVRHRKYPFRGVIFDVDPTFSNTEEWWMSIPEDVRPTRDQPFYHLFAENAETEYIAYVSEQNLLPDDTREPVRHPQIAEVFVRSRDGRYRLKPIARN